MNKFSKLAVASVAAFFVAPLASAGVVEDYIHRHPATAAVKRTGTRVITHSRGCALGKYMGRYQFHTAQKLDLMTICSKAHKSLADLDDTIRHEAVHVAQICRSRGPVSDTNYARLATPKIHSALADYPKDSYAFELEAYVIADQQTNEEVAQLVLEVCANYLD